jgi:hypothetical protein
MLNREAVLADIRAKLGRFLGETKLRKNVGYDLKHLYCRTWLPGKVEKITSQ